MIIIDGQKEAKRILEKIKKQMNVFKKQAIKLKLVAILVGENKSSLSFIKKKEELCKKIGIKFELFKFEKDIEENNLCRKIKIIQEEKDLSGLIVQLPLPSFLNARTVLEQIKPEYDVDCLTSFNLGKLTAGIYTILPPTPAACLHLLRAQKISILGKHVVVVGRGDLVGKPLGVLLTQEKNTITLCNEYTKNLAKFTRQADILITAVGVPHLISGKMVKKGVVVLDAGINFKNRKLYGDCKFNEVAKKASFITPVPGGVGPVTVVKLLENVLKLAERNNFLHK
jgi:methylenetetrahydrofolate dehydrogenase (NADP+)/methenyltetrahydrofolate cyclohydrolase